MSDQRYVKFTAAVDRAEIRTATFNGAQQVVVPVVALVGDIVIRPHGSKGPEFVPARVLSLAPESWDGRPVVEDHPMAGSVPVSANSPERLESESFGQVFNTRFEDGRLRTEAWLDVNKAATIGGKAQEVVQDMLNGDRVLEVSIGAYATSEQVSGSHNGKSYSTVWTGLIPDHLAVGLGGKRGACSVEAGCGAPRINTANTNTDQPYTMRAAEDGGQMTDKSQNMMQRLLAWLRVNQEGLSDSELRVQLGELLNSIEPAFEGVMDVYPDSNEVIYITMPEGKMLHWRRTFTKDGGSVAVSDDAEQVEPTTSYTPVTAEAAADGNTEPEDAPATSEPQAEGAGSAGSADDGTSSTTAARAAGCACDKATKAATTTGGSDMSDLKKLVDRLVAKAPEQFTDEDRGALAGLGEEKLTALLEANAPEPEPQADPDPQPQSAEDWMQSAPAEVRDLVARHQRQEAQHRAHLIKALASAQDVITAEELADKPTEDLEKLSQVLKVEDRHPDYSLRPTPQALGAGEEPRDFTPPDPWNIEGLQKAAKEAN